MNIAFRVDASSRIGTGHFMRCLTLADALKERGGTSRFLSRNLPEHLLGLLDSRGHSLLPLGSGDGVADGGLAHSAWLGTSQQADARACIEALNGLPCDWLVVDHYALDDRWESSLREQAKNIFVIDDLADRNHDCDLLLDQNLNSESPARYEGRTPKGCQMLMGPRHALLRREFGSQREAVSAREGPVQRLLVFFGGIDERNFTGKTLQALSLISRQHLKVDVVIGALHPFRDKILSTCSSLDFSCHVETSRIAELMAAADLSIGAGGTAVWERLSLGVPTFAIPTADNQIRQLQDLAIHGLVYSPQIQNPGPDSIHAHLLGLLENPAILQAISRAALRTVDGRGVERVLGCLEGREIAIREAKPTDSKDIFTWRNDPRVRGASNNQAQILWQDHEAWFARMLVSPDNILLLGCLEDDPLGVVRFDVSNGVAEVSIYRVPGGEGRRLGRALLYQAEVWLLDHRKDVTSFEATVRQGNHASISMFSDAGYVLSQTRFAKTANPVL